MASRLLKDSVRANTVYCIVKTGEFQRHTRQTRLPASTNDPAVITKTAEELMSSLLTGPDGLFSAGQVLRLIGVGCSGIDDSPFTQLDLFSWAKERQEEEKCRQEELMAKEKSGEEMRKRAEKQRKLDEMLSKVQEKYGTKALRKGGE